MIFHTPLACFKGAMQIFHLLPAQIMTKWEMLEQEFYNGEWTLQVLLTKEKHKLEALLKGICS